MDSCKLNILKSHLTFPINFIDIDTLKGCWLRNYKKVLVIVSLIAVILKLTNNYHKNINLSRKIASESIVSSESCYYIINRFMGSDTELLFSDLDILDVIFSIYTKEKPRLNLYSNDLLLVLKKIYETDSEEDLIANIKNKSNLTLIKRYFNDREIAGMYGRYSQFTIDLLKRNAEKERGHDFHSGWGWRLLRDDDIAFQDNEYKVNLLKSSTLTAVGEDQIDHVGVMSLFHESWEKIAPSNTKMIEFFLTGTDSNNRLYDYATEVAKKRSEGKVKSGEILGFDNLYGGGRGKMREMSSVLSNDRSLVKYKIAAPSTYSFNPKSVEEIKRLKKVEGEALQAIRKKFTENLEIGGFMLESVTGSNGFQVFRPEFLVKLRALCDEFKIPIFADEVLTGGGRTGKFFAYQHYDGFEPDYITVGKGLVISGIAKVERDVKLHEVSKPITTISSYTESLLKSRQVLNRIHSDDLMESVVENGDYLLSELIKKKKKKLLAEAEDEIDFIQRQLKLNKEELDSYSNFDTYYERVLNNHKAMKKRAIDYLAKYEDELNSLEAGTPRHEVVLAYIEDYNITILKEDPVYNEVKLVFDNTVDSIRKEIAKKEQELAIAQKELEDIQNGDREYFIANHIRGFGYMLYGAPLNARPSMGRHFPPLTLSRAEIDELLVE